MKHAKAIQVLSLLAGLSAMVQSAAGLFWQSPGESFPFTTLRSGTVQMAGQGIYAYDTYFKAPIFRGTDAVTLFVCLPLLVIALILCRRGSLRGTLFQAGVLAYMLYNAGSIALGVTYNNLFLVYVAYFSSCLFALALVVSSIDLTDLATRVSSSAPRRGIAALMFVSAVALLFAWMTDILGALFKGSIPAIASYTTEVTYVFDLGIIVPLSLLTGVLTLRRAPVSYLLSSILMVVLVIVGVLVTVQTVFQSMAGIEMPIGEFIGKTGSFMLLSLFAAGLLVQLFKHVQSPDTLNQPAAARTTAPLS